MSKNHLKRLSAPATWQIKRKKNKFITRPNPGPHSLKFGMPINSIFRDLLDYGRTTRDIKNILNNKNILIDGIRRKDYRFIVGLFDTIAIPESDEYFRIALDKKGRVSLIKIEKDEANTKPCRIIGKTKIKGKMQLNLFDGKNVLVDNDSYKVGDTLVMGLPKLQIKAHLKLEKKASICLIGGKYMGDIGTVEDIKDNNLSYKSAKNGEVVETLKSYAFVIGEGKPAVKITE